MNCAAYRSRILRGESEETLSEHLSECEPCALLAADGAVLARGLELQVPADFNVDALLESTRAQIRAAPSWRLGLMQLPNNMRLFAMLLAMSVYVGIGGLGLRRADFASLDPVLLWSQIGFLVAVGVVGLVATMRPVHVPELRTGQAIAVIALASLAPLAVLAWPPLGPPMGPMPFTAMIAPTAMCFGYGSAIAAGVLVAWRLFEQRSQPDFRLVATAGATAAAVGNAALVLHCPSSDPVHILSGHASIALIWGSVLLMFAFLRADHS